MKETVLNVALLGMNPRNTSTIEYFIKKNASQYFQVTNAKEAAAFIVDFDAEEGLSVKFDRLVGNKPVIIISSSDPAKPRSIWVQKPINAGAMSSAISALLKLINQCNQESKPEVLSKLKEKETLKQRKALDSERIEKSTSDSKSKKEMGYQDGFSDDHSPSLNLSQKSIVECCGTQVDGDGSSPSFRKQVSYDPTLTLLTSIQNSIEKARDENVSVELDVGRESLVFMPGGKKVLANISGHVLRHLCAVSLQKQPVIKVLTGDLVENNQKHSTNHQNMIHSDTLIWQVALWTSRGRLPKDILPDKPLTVTSWPNFTRLTITPHAIAIASVWVKNTISPLDLAEHMQIPQRYVFAFLAATSALGLVEQASEKEKPSELSWKKPQAFLSSILRSLKLG